MLYESMVEAHGATGVVGQRAETFSLYIFIPAVGDGRR